MQEVIHHLVTSKEFRMQGYAPDGNRMIMDNHDKDGINCLIYKEAVDGMTAYCKIYNKMVQMLESECENWYR